MSEILEDFQQEEAIKEPEAANYSFAVIGEVYEDGVSLIFPGSEEPSEKHYKANLYCKFKAGQRVYIAKDSGTYIALFPVGKPGSESVVADTATNATNATKAENATNASNADKAATSDKLSSERTIKLTGAVTGSGQFDGSQNLTINTSMGSSGTVDRAETADRWTTSRTLTLSGDATGSVSFNGSSNFTLNITVKEFTERHSGSRLGFFNTSPTSKNYVSKLNSTPTVNNLKTQLNNLIGALNEYGLV